ncbi:uncharacterized protein LOC142542394 isoform X2 [Primulina tabacum]|uniref:uncharacterized protein LOC142542394 isoform X2 n=1 Tax=Primulina tabacum TaxID=48773 RepID=UPI003F59DF4F
MGRLRAKSDYEGIRNARISENQARLASLGLQKTILELRSLSSSAKSERTLVRKYCKVDYRSTPLRRSARLSGKSPTSQVRGSTGNSKEKNPGNGFRGRPKRGGSLLAISPEALARRCERKGRGSMYNPGNSKEKNHGNGFRGRPKRGGSLLMISPEALARRCERKGRGSLYNPVYGICCHFCRQKKLCGEEDCKHCGYLDMDEPCTGKTDCSNCHSSNGILCRACLKVRYGEEMEEVRANKEWICPHCVEDKGVNLFGYVIVHCCLKQRKMVPTGIAIYRARKMGYKSVAHMLMEELARADKSRR